MEKPESGAVSSPYKDTEDRLESDFRKKCAEAMSDELGEDEDVAILGRGPEFAIFFGVDGL